MAVKLFGKTIVGGEAQRKEASANEFIGKYPLSSDCNEMQNTINRAKAELAQINASRPSTSGGKRIKARNSSALSSWIGEMNNYNKDLTCGIVSTSEGVSIVPTESTPPQVVAAPTIQSPSTSQKVASIITTKDCIQVTYDCNGGSRESLIKIPIDANCNDYQPSLPQCLEIVPPPKPDLPTIAPTTSTTTTTTTQAPKSLRVANPTTEVVTEYRNTNEPTPIVAPTSDKKEEYLMYGALALVALLILTRND